MTDPSHNEHQQQLIGLHRLLMGSVSRVSIVLREIIALHAVLFLLSSMMKLATEALFTSTLRLFGYNPSNYYGVCWVSLRITLF